MEIESIAGTSDAIFRFFNERGVVSSAILLLRCVSISCALAIILSFDNTSLGNITLTGSLTLAAIYASWGLDKLVPQWSHKHKFVSCFVQCNFLPPHVVFVNTSSYKQIFYLILWSPKYGSHAAVGDCSLGRRGH